MIQEDILTKLEFHKVLSAIAKYCATEAGKKRVLSLRPFDENERVSEGALSMQAKEILIRRSHPPFETLPDLTEDLFLTRIDGSLLSAQKILQVLKLAVSSRVLHGFFIQQADIAKDLLPFADALFADKLFEHHITRVLDENGDMKDSASRELQKIRSEIKEKNFQLRKLVSKIARDLADQDLLREDYLTLRDGRMVLPIRVENKRQIKGFIHSESATGQTVYIEPEETLHLNNEIVTLTFAERREIERILRDVTRKIGEYSSTLLEAHKTIGFFDSLFARAQFAVEVIGAFPTINSNAPFTLITARHPILLQKIGREKAVPLELELKENKIIVVTGPNAGGKTVVIKTIGLLTLMVFAGIPIPASPDSNFHEINKVFVDIGDQQSIEEDLSTFSSHLSNIRNILSSADDKTLVLLDELGTGTDPVAGAALGIATLLTLRESGANVFATTHHGILKTLAESNNGFENAAMEFDTINLRPTYRFRQGIPGSSYAFEIASRLGFEPEFITLAESYLDTDQKQIENSLLAIEKKEQQLREKLKEYEIENSRLTGLASVYQKKIQQLERDKKAILKKAEEDSRHFLAVASREFEQLVKDVRETQAEKAVIKKAKNFLNDLSKTTDEQAAKSSLPPPEAFVPKPEDTVKIKKTGTAGKVIDIDADRQTARFLTGNVIMNVAFSDLEKADKDPAVAGSGLKYASMRDEIKYRLDIRGKRPDEAQMQIVKFLDESYSTGLDRVEILHGKGSGVLKKLVKDILNDHIGVKNSYFAPVQAGGEGITIIEFKP